MKMSRCRRAQPQRKGCKCVAKSSGVPVWRCRWTRTRRSTAATTSLRCRETHWPRCGRERTSTIFPPATPSPRAAAHVARSERMFIAGKTDTMTVQRLCGIMSRELSKTVGAQEVGAANIPVKFTHREDVDGRLINRRTGRDCGGWRPAEQQHGRHQPS